jgi:hypothetical protein
LFNSSAPTDNRSARFWIYLPLALVLVFIGISMTFVFNAMVTTYDFRYHADYARVWYEQGQPPIPLPHTLYHLTLMALKRALPASSFNQLSVLVMVGISMLTATLLYAYLLSGFAKTSQRIYWITAGLTLILTLVAPITFFTWDSQNLYFGYIVPYIYHNPTSIFIKAMTLALFWIASDALAGRQSPCWVWGAALVLSILMPIGKPNYTLALLPGLGLLTAIRWSRRAAITPGMLVLGIALPSTLVILFQFITFSGESQLAFSPFTVFYDWGLTRGMLLRGTLLSLLYPLVVAGLFYRQAVRLVALQLAWVVMGISLFQMFTLVEGRDASAMNWNWGALLNSFILFAATTRFLIEQERAASLGWRGWIAGGVLAAHLVCGIVWLFFH